MSFSPFKKSYYYHTDSVSISIASGSKRMNAIFHALKSTTRGDVKTAAIAHRTTHDNDDSREVREKAWMEVAS